MQPVPPTSIPPRIPRPRPAPVTESPRIAALGTDPTAVEAFWAEVAADGTPLVEAVDGSSATLTFVWRAGGGAPPLLLANKLTDRSDLAASRMRRLSGTDVWHLSYRLPADWRGSYVIDDGEQHVDPLNPRLLRPGRSVAEGPAAPPQQYLEPRSGVPAGRVERHGGTSVYLPPGYLAANGPYPLLVLLDGETWTRTSPVAPTLDNLIAAGRIPPLVALLPDAGDRPTRFTTYACDDRFAAYLADDLVPWAADRWSVTADPAETVIAGQSLGGLAAAHAALTRPERFGAVLSQSGSFWWPSGEPARAEELTRRYAAAPRRAVRFHLQVGSDEWVNLAPSRRLRSALVAVGHPVTYREYSGGHDLAWWRGGLADGLIALRGR